MQTTSTQIQTDMASCSSLLLEEQFECSICLDIFIDPVTTPCGHNFCKACITQHWDSTDPCQCPLCKKTFEKRPALFVNTVMSELAAPFRKSVAVKAGSSPDQHPAKPDVSCDFCTGTKLRALKSCLVCQTSYCETHLEPHQRVPGLVKHKLIDPVENLEDRMCKKHERPLELFCRTDRTCVCQFCTETDHKTHDTVSLEEECERQKAQLGKTGEDVQKIIQERLQKVREIKLSVETSKRETERKIADSVEAFSALVRSIERSQAELIQAFEEKHRAAEKQAEGFIQELEREIAELKRRSAELEQLSHTEDPLHLLQISPSLSTPPHSKDWSQISVRSSVGTELRVLSQLEDTLTSEIKKLRCVELKRIQQYAVDVILDPDTANPFLTLSEYGKQVRFGRKQNVLENPDRFDVFPGVLGKQSFSSGRFYYEVQVRGWDWDLGVVRESINRKGPITLSLEDGYWVLSLRNGNEYDTGGDDISLRDKPQKVGVFVDCEEGQVSFYDVETKSHIDSFTGCTFTEKLYTFFGPEAKFGQNPASHQSFQPLIIITDLST